MTPTNYQDPGENRQIPGHILKAFRSVEKFLPVVDIVLELVDARMPHGSRLDKLVGKLGKDSVLVLGKSDLADPTDTEAWKKFFEEENHVCLLFSFKEHDSVKRMLNFLRKMPLKMSVDHEKKIRRIMIVGIPNVGKSTLINSLSGRRAAKTANLPGVTKNIQWIKLSQDLELLDLPGILDFSLLRRGEILRLINTIPGPDEDPVEYAVTLFQTLCAARFTGKIPGMEEFIDRPIEFFADYAVKRNFIKRGGTPDTIRAARDFLKRFQSGKLGRISLERPQVTSHLNCEHQG